MPELFTHLWALGFVLFLADYLGTHEYRLYRPVSVCIGACALWFVLLPFGIKRYGLRG